MPHPRGTIHLRLHILSCPCLNRVHILGHVAGTSSAGCDHGSLQGGRLKVLWLKLGRLGAVDHVACAATATARELSSPAHREWIMTLRPKRQLFFRQIENRDASGKRSLTEERLWNVSAKYAVVCKSSKRSWHWYST